MQAIGKILTLDASEDQGRFEEFMAPFANMFRTVQSEMANVHAGNADTLKVCWLLVEVSI